MITHQTGTGDYRLGGLAWGEAGGGEEWRGCKVVYKVATELQAVESLKKVISAAIYSLIFLRMTLSVEL